MWADRILEFRDRQGGFRHMNDLLQVGGIGESTLAKLRPHVCIVSEWEDPASPAESKPKIGKGGDLRTPIDINRADATEFERLPGIGKKMAQRIVDERGRKPFRTVEDLRRVPGIGAKTLEHLRPYVCVTQEPARMD